MQLTGGVPVARAFARASSLFRRPQLIPVFDGRKGGWMKWRLGVPIALLLLGTTVVRADDVEQNTQIVRRLYDELFTKWNLAVIDEVFSPEYLGHEMPPGTPRGPEGIRRLYARFREGLPDIRFTVEDLIAGGDRVVVRWRVNATHRGVVQGIPPTGAQVSFEGIAIYRLSKGKVVERWVVADRAGLLDQLHAATAATPK
jgi:predicted ester cyclase